MRGNVEILLSFLTVVTMLIFASPKAIAGEPEDSNEWQDKRYDWVLKLKPSQLQGYANYRCSTLTPVSKIQVLFRNHGSNAFKPYVQLLYANGHALGCNRSDKLSVDKDSRGAIVIDSKEKFDTEPSALANAIARLTLEVGLQNAAVVAVVVDEDSIAPLAGQMKKYGFSARSPLVEPNPTALSVVVTPGSDSNSSVMLDRPIGI